jgi:hypothetical protein
MAIQHNVDHVRQELIDILPRYEMIEDCLEGEYAVKEKKTTYLPKPNPTDTSAANQSRYEDYIKRAIFYNVTARTSDALVGQIFLRPPEIELPELLGPIEENANGEGLDIIQLTKEACNYVLPYGRGGMLTDYPTTEGMVSRGDIMEGRVRPTIRFYKPQDIINWETRVIGNETVLTMVVLKEVFERRDEGSFKVSKYEQFRALELLDDGCVRVSIFVYDADHRGMDRERVYTICDVEGNEFGRIPFTFIGSENNDPYIDRPPLYTMSVLNIAHYRNSADYEESLYFIGQPTLFIAGVTEDWVKDVWKGTLRLGARGVIPGPPDSSASLIQATPNSLAKEGMDQKEEQMISVGAKLVERKSGVERKEKEIEIEAAGDTSILTSIAQNVEEAVVESLKFAARFVGADESQIKFNVNKNFDLTSLTAEELRQINEIADSDNPVLSFEERRAIVKRSGYAFQPLEEAKAAIAQDMETRAAFAKLMAEATNVNPVNPDTGNQEPTQQELDFDESQQR